MRTIFEKIHCPLCKNPLEYTLKDMTHIFKCTHCPFVGFEFYKAENMDALAETLNVRIWKTTDIPY